MILQYAEFYDLFDSNSQYMLHLIPPTFYGKNKLMTLECNTS